MTDRDKFYKAVNDLALPAQYITLDKTSKYTLRKYKSKDQKKKLLNHIKAHLNDSHINYNDPFASLYAESILLIACPSADLLEFDSGIQKIISDQNKKNREYIQMHKKLPEISPVFKSVCKIYVMEHSRRVLIEALHDTTNYLLNHKDPSEIINDAKHLILNSKFLNWSYQAALDTGNTDILKNANPYKFVKIALKMMLFLNVSAVRDSRTKKHLSPTQRKGYAEYLFDNAYEASNWL